METEPANNKVATAGKRTTSGTAEAADAYVSACGKFILTGEHAVVQGRKAIARPLKAGIIRAFIANVVDPDWYKQLHPLIPLSMAEIGLDRWFDQHTDKQLFIDGDLPIGIGLGASAAVVVALIRLDEALHGYRYDFDDALALGRKCEDYVHGRSSGLDVAVALQQKPIVFSQNGIDVTHYPPEQHIKLVNTGTPTRSTGECVEKVGRNFPGDAAIWDSFTDICAQILTNGVTPDLIRRNHALLCEIGVVSDPVQAFVRAIEDAGGAAKISGGGNIDDDAKSAGIVIAIGVHEDTLREICDAYGYSLLPGKH